jgi:integrase/recombinase XerD
MSGSRLQHRWIDETRTLADSPAAAYLASIGPGSRRTMQQCLTTLGSMLAGTEVDPNKVRWEHLRRENTLDLRHRLQESFAPATANKMLSALRGVLRAARRAGLMREGDFQTAASLEPIKPAPPPARVDVTADVARSLFEACRGDDAANRRDAAMLAIFMSSGLRRSEAAALDVADYDAKTGRLHIPGEKPENDRQVTLPRPARAAMEAWLEVRSVAAGPLLLPVDRGGLVRFRRMTDQALYDIFGRITRRGGVPGLSLRDLRRSYVLGLIRAGHDTRQTQYLVGHASWLTTAAYVALAGQTDAKTYDLNALPYRPPGKARP